MYASEVGARVFPGCFLSIPRKSRKRVALRLPFYRRVAFFQKACVCLRCLGARLGRLFRWACQKRDAQVPKAIF
jgi:hypothetical protein